MRSHWKNKRVRRLLLLSAGLAVGGLIYLSWPLIQGFQHADEQIFMKQKQLAKFQQAVAEAAGLDRELESLNQTVKQTEANLLNAATASLAAADIQTILSQIARSSGVEIKSVRVLKPAKLKHEGYVGIPVQFTLATTVRQLKEILYRIESSTKLLTVDNLRINVARFRKTTEIQSDITVMGFMKKGSLE